MDVQIWIDRLADREPGRDGSHVLESSYVAEVLGSYGI